MPYDGDITQFTSPSTDAESVLLRAAEIIRERGLHKGSYGRAGKAVCAMGAIHEAECGYWAPADRVFSTQAAMRLQMLLNETDERLDILRWNDAPDRTADEVVATLRAAAQHSRAEGQT